MAQFRVVVTDQVFPDVHVERAMIEALGGVLEVARGTREQVLEAARDADALLTTYFALDASAIAGLTKCRIVARYGIGVDNIDLDAARAAGIAVTNVPDYCVEEVATHTLALMLALVRRIPQGDAIVRSGGWGISQLGDVRRLSSLTVGLLGYGRIAHAVSVAVRALGASVIVHDPYVSNLDEGEQLVTRPALFEAADIVSLHCPLTSETRGLIDSAAIAMMKPTTILINTSRGPIVVLDDVIAAIRDHRLGGAGLDVFDPEPPSSASFEGLPNLLLTPHAAFYSSEAIAESQRKATTQILSALHGRRLDYQVA
jgi:D-3-phosphoglycerate dehydrogenase